MATHLVRLHRLVLSLLVVISYVGAAPPQLVSVLEVASGRQEDDPYRLDGSVLPEQYFLTLEPNLDIGTFEGTVVIEVKAVESVDVVTLHSLDLVFDEVKVTLKDTDTDMYDKENFLENYQMAQLLLKENLVVGDVYIITIQYHGKLQDNMYGFYISTYNNGVSKLAATQFQATHARKAFPCFDEPSFKARFQVTIIAPPDYTALSNMPQVDAVPLEDNSIKFTFNNSLIMSPYLVAFVVSQFVASPDENNDVAGAVTFNTWTRPDATERSEYSLKVSRSMLEVLEEYTGIPYHDTGDAYPLNKVDQVALPDFAAGAMENWGLITYRENALLFNDGSADAMKRVATVIAHELLHMWFGNLITTHWWDTTWLNEGFARYFQYYVTDKAETEDWRMWDQFLVDQHQMVFALDSLVTAKALTHDVSTPEQVSASFGTITYSKGGSILRMISYLIGPENFQKALQNYLIEYNYRSVVPQNLFDKLKPFAVYANLEDDEFEELLKSWTEQPGYPTVTVIRNYNTNSATIQQERFLFEGTAAEEYIIPITFTQGDSFDVPTPTLYLGKSSTRNVITIPDSNKWVIFNVQETGYYRVNYDEDNWNLISKHLNDHANPISDIHILNRAQLLDDAFNLARASKLEYEVAFDLADYLSRETDYVPWAAAFSAFSYLDRMLVNHQKYPVFQRYIARLIDKVYGQFRETISFNEAPERHDEKLLMNRLVSWACKTGRESCIGHAVLRFRRQLENVMRVNADQRSAVYCHGIYNSPDFYWSEMWNLYETSDDDVERALIISGLACSREEARLTQLLQLSIADGSIRKQDASSVFTAVYANPIGVGVALDFLDENFQQVVDYYGSVTTSAMDSIGSIVTGIAARITTSEQREKLQNLVTKFEDELGTSGDAALATVDDNFKWLATHENVIFQLLEEKELRLYRLPESVKPNDYTIFLDPVMESRSFAGTVTINVNVNYPTEVIILHAASITAQYISVKSVDDETDDDENLFESVSYDSTLQLMVLHLHRSLNADKQYEISMFFSGFFRRDMYGFYLSTYTNEENKEVLLAATQFQPTHARSAFPCFDEPSFKATFSVTIRTPENYHALGNMPIVESRRRNSFSTDVQFERTPVMPTYLLAFVISDFVEWEDRLATGGVLFRTWARKDALPWAEYSIQVSRPLLETLEEITGIEYIDRRLEHPFDKVDQVAVPDFSAGAMENWGLITYRETALLYNDGTASARKSVATIIAHELTHMWFGNLVTTHWWDTTWLNEGFAQYYQFYATSIVKPEWRLMDQFLVDHHQGVFASDSLATSAALTAPAYTPSQVIARFGTITYSKGASVLRMISAIMGETNFDEALHDYLTEYRYSSTIPENLFKHFIDKSSNTNLDENAFETFLLSWTEQPGFPVLRIVRNYDESSATVSQARFLLKTPVTPDPRLYYVPLTWVGPGGDFDDTAPKTYLPQTQSVTISGMPAAGQWVIFNVQETGFYRVNYDYTNWNMLAEYLNDSSNPLDGIHVLNRAQLLDDAFNLGRAGQLEYSTVFNLADYLHRELDFIPWASAFAAFSYLQRMLIYNERYNYFEEYVRNLLEERYNHYNFENREGHIDKLFLNRVSSWACSLQHSHCINTARTSLEGFIDENIVVPADLRSVVYCYGVRHSPDSYWQKLLEEYQNSMDSAERSLLMAGLACTHNENLLNELLYHSIQGTFIRTQDASSVFSSVYSNSRGVEVALNFLDENFDAVEEYYGSMGAINNIVVGIASRLTTEEQRAKMEIFVQKHSDALGSTGAAALETIDENLEWLQNHGENILDILSGVVTTTEEPSTEEPSTEEPSTEEPSTEEPSTESTTKGAGSLRATVIGVLALLVAIRLL